jgi:hypothetical protein
MPKQCSGSVVTGEKIDRNVVKTDVTLGKRVMKMAYAKVLKMLVPDAVQMLKQKVITEEPEAKIINVRDRLTVPDFFKVTEKVTDETTVQTALSGIAVDISK